MESHYSLIISRPFMGFQVPISKCRVIVISEFNGLTSGHILRVLS